MDKTKKKYIKKTVDAVIIAIFIVLVFCLAWVFGQIVTGNPPSLFGYNAYTVLTNSMEPTIMTKDVIIAKKVKDTSKLEEGMIVTFIAPKGFANNPSLEGKFITHRIEELHLEDGYIVTKGDNPSATRDIHIPSENVVAVYCKTSGFMKGLITVISNPFGFLAIVIVPLVGVLISQILVLVKGAKSKNQKSDGEKDIMSDEVKILNDEEIEKLAREQALEEYNKSLDKKIESEEKKEE